MTPGPAGPRRVRILADDLTGALDTAVEFSGETDDPVVTWRDGPDAAATILARDLETRELPPAPAARRWSREAWRLEGADLALKKIDSLLRGHVAREIAALLAGGRFTRCLLAPAFPDQGRITRGGRQWVARGAGEWREVGRDLVAELRCSGVPARVLPVDRLAEAYEGCQLVDAASNDDLRRLVAAAAPWPGTTLWCGTAGLGRALARAEPVRPRVPAAVLAIIGTVHAATRVQISRWGERCGVPVGLLEREHEARAAISRVRDGGHAALLLSGDAPLDAATARQRIAERLALLAAAPQPPPAVLVSGGETLTALCRATGSGHLVVGGQLAPGVPCSTLCGGSWAGTIVVSKSGAFGGPDLLAALFPRA